MHVLVTAGPTREYIDPVRFISNRSSGTTGYELAATALRRRHRVTLVSGPVSLQAPRGANLIKIVSAEDMYRACLDVFPKVDVAVLTAAVCDYRPRTRHATKIKKTAGATSLPLIRTPDTLAELGRRKYDRQVLIGFALEDRRPKTSAKAKLQAKNLDAIVLNSPSALASANNRVCVYHAGMWQDWPTMSKRALGVRIVRLAERLFKLRQET